MEIMTLQELINEKNITVKEISERTGLSQALLSLLKNDKIAVSDKTNLIFKEAFKVELIDNNPLYIAEKKISSLSQEVKKTKQEQNQKNEYIKMQNNKNLVLEKILNMDSSFFSDNNVHKIYKTLRKITKEI